MALKLVFDSTTGWWEFAGEPSEEDPLEVTIKEKWKPIAELLRREPEARIVDGGSYTCALCREYPTSCEGCPVQVYTGLGGCEGTPFVDWKAYGDLRSAEAMVKFLIGLRDSA